MRILVIGAVAAGTSAAAKARRNDEHAEIIIYEMDQNISYSGCGLPYYIGDEIEDIDDLTPRDPAFFKSKYNIDIFIGHEVVRIDPLQKLVEVKNSLTNETFIDQYDRLIIATGASPLIPKEVGGIQQEHVFALRNVQSANKIKQYIINNKPKSAVIIGTGFIGFEMLENLMEHGITVSMIEKNNHIVPNLDVDVSLYLENMLTAYNVRIHKGVTVTSIDSDSVHLSNSVIVDADMVIVAMGVKPNITLAESAGVTLGITGAIQVNSHMQTNFPDIYACGDCIETYNTITKKPCYKPLGSTANKTGRIAGDQVTGGDLTYRGNLGTGIFKLFDLTVAFTGYSEQEAVKDGYEIVTCHNIKPDKPKYYHGKEMLIKAIADKQTKRLLGVQIIGHQGVDKRIDVFATLITYGATVDDLFHLDLAYAPPFSTTKDPVHYTGMVLDNAINKERPLITSNELRHLQSDNVDIQVVDARTSTQYEKSHIPGAINIPHKSIRKSLDSLDPSKLTVTYCNKGVTGNAVQNILLGSGFKNVKNLSGGNKFYQTTNSKNEF